MAKKSTKKKSVSKKKTTKKKAAKKPAAKKSSTKKKTTKKSTKKKPTKKKVTKKKVTKKSTKTSKPAAKKTTKKTTKKSTKKAVAAKPARKTTKANGKSKTVVSDRVARIRASLRRGRENVVQEKIETKNLTTAELKKIKSGLTRKDMDHYKQMLLAKRAELLKDVESLQNESLNSGEGISYEHMADVGTDNYEQEFTLELMESEKLLLTRINDALIRMREGTYGVCVETGKPIGKARLEAKPWAKWCIEVARANERLGKVG